jgi:hypothetical protein
MIGVVAVARALKTRDAPTSNALLDASRTVFKRLGAPVKPTARRPRRYSKK